MPRISVVEQYDNKDLIQQIYRLKDLVETGTASNIAITDNHDGTITVDVTMRDGTLQTFTLANDNIATIAAVQNGADVTVTVTFESGSTQSFTFNVASGKVDVLTTAGAYVYAHTGATQNEQPYAINAVAGSIMQRDASGQTEVTSPAADTDSDYAVNMTKLNARLTDGSVTKIGTSNVGSDTKPIKLVAGVPTAITNDLVDLPSAQAITGAKTVPLEATGTFTDQIASSNKVKNELDNYAPMVRTTGNQSIAGTKGFTGRTDLSNAKMNTMTPQSTGTGNNGQWRVVAKVTGLTGSDNVRFNFFALSNQSSRFMLAQARFANSIPTINVWLHKSFSETAVAINYDGNGNAILLMQTLYAYQSPLLFPILVQRNDVVNSAAVDYTDTTTYASSSDFPYANTVYGTFIGVDV